VVEAIVAIPAVFAAGAGLLLERRCLGQIAFVQPMVLCALVGLFSGQTEACLWIGVSLQLLSVGQGHHADWALAGFVAAASLAVWSVLWGSDVTPGSVVALTALSASVAAAMLARSLELSLARTDGALQRRVPIWEGKDPVGALERHARRRVFRCAAQGGVEGIAGTALAVGGMYAASFAEAPPVIVVSAARLAVPGLALAVALGAMAGYRFVGYSAAGFAAVFAASVAL
jgi:mannose/fructose/N-acetylgalactosamine-specific phosphotransferase system component IIC